MKYTVNWTLDTGKKQHKPGAVIEMKEAEAESLVACGVLTPLAEQPAAPPAPPPATGGTGGTGNDDQAGAQGGGTNE